MEDEGDVYSDVQLTVVHRKHNNGEDSDNNLAKLKQFAFSSELQVHIKLGREGEKEHQWREEGREKMSGEGRERKRGKERQ